MIVSEPINLQKKGGIHGDADACGTLPSPSEHRKKATKHYHRSSASRTPEYKGVSQLCILHFLFSSGSGSGQTAALFLVLHMSGVSGVLHDQSPDTEGGCRGYRRRQNLLIEDVPQQGNIDNIYHN